ncbi:hypothetical protein PBY51_014224 [Eleginops maclovinus]|uniref:Uncharacterized protein n=1 Tax=Eleginops maclovinus TaxID=56733 RepID=A0AAN8ACF4_ELEMC|nr:hypothetical protein PBY51_014224 [Eleginops maclovinus]
MWELSSSRHLKLLPHIPMWDIPSFKQCLKLISPYSHWPSHISRLGPPKSRPSRVFSTPNWSHQFQASTPHPHVVLTSTSRVKLPSPDKASKLSHPTSPLRVLPHTSSRCWSRPFQGPLPPHPHVGPHKFQMAQAPP